MFSCNMSVKSYFLVILTATPQSSDMAGASTHRSYNSSRACCCNCYLGVGRPSPCSQFGITRFTTLKHVCVKMCTSLSICWISVPLEINRDKPFLQNILQTAFLITWLTISSWNLQVGNFSKGNQKFYYELILLLSIQCFYSVPNFSILSENRTL